MSKRPNSHYALSYPQCTWQTWTTENVQAMTFKSIYHLLPSSPLCCHILVIVTQSQKTWGKGDSVNYFYYVHLLFLWLRKIKVKKQGLVFYSSSSLLYQIMLYPAWIQYHTCNLLVLNIFCFCRHSIHSPPSLNSTFVFLWGSTLIPFQAVLVEPSTT